MGRILGLLRSGSSFCVLYALTTSFEDDELYRGPLRYWGEEVEAAFLLIDVVALLA
jgi:hypothetical protein